MKKKFIGASLAFVMLFSVMAAPIKVLAESVQTKEITILHTNDVHGRAEENEKNGEIGYAKLKTYADSIPNTILIDAGDVVHGTTFATITRGESMIKLMEQVGYVAMTPGNHDFNYGYDRLKELSKEVDFPILAANVITQAGNQELPANTIVEVDGVKVGIFGLATDETKTKSNPLNTKGLLFLDNIEVAREQVDSLKKQGAEVIIANVHLGLDESSVNKSSDLAEKVEGIDLIIDGHSHTSLPTGKVVNDTLIVQTGGHLSQLGQVKLQVENGKVLTKSATLLGYDFFKNVTPNKEILASIDTVQALNQPYLEKVIGEAKVELDGVRENVRRGETNLGNLLTDSMLAESKADVAITNGGGIRASIDQGEITMGEILTSFPFANYPVKLEVSGKTILEALEYGVDAAPELAGKFPHVSGMTFKYDPKQKPGSRIIEVLVKGKALDLEKTYTLVTNDFMAIGGDGYEMFKTAKKVAEYPLLSEVLANYIQKEKVVSPKIEGRILVEDKVDKPVEESKFTDINNHWAEKYILDVVEKKYFNGMSETIFAPNKNITRGMLVTTLARLSYEDKTQEKTANLKDFSDVKAGEWYSNAVNWAVKNQLVKGYEDGTFRPDREVSREEMATILGRFVAMKNLPVTLMLPLPFEDEEQISDWAQENITLVRNAGIMQGKDGNRFDPKGKATRAELAKVIFELDARIEKKNVPSKDNSVKEETNKAEGKELKEKPAA